MKMKEASIISFSIISLIVFAFSLQSSVGFSVGPSPPQPPPTQPVARIKDTKVAVGGKATSSIVPPPHALSQNVTLTNYMRLPVQQYTLIPMPLGSSLKINGGKDDILLSDETEFELVVPTIHFFKLSLQPVVYASVQPQENRVVISSNNCILRGSDFIERVQLNERFDFSVTTTLTWEDALHSEQPDLSQDSNNGDTSIMDCCSITAETSIDVNVDVPRPFNTIPKMILQRTGNAAVKLSLKYIAGNFVNNLANDYNKWATELEYRNYRASLSEKGAVVEEEQLSELNW